MWKKIVESRDLIIYERKYKGILIKIEARQDDSRWSIFMKYLGDNEVDYVEEFSAATKDELGFIMKKLMKKSISLKQVEEMKLRSKKIPGINLKRDFKEYSMEKWVFSIAGDRIKNLIFIKFDDITELDVVIHERYKPLQTKIVKQITETFNLENQAVDVKLNLFYFNDHNSLDVDQDKKNLFVGKVELGFDAE